MDLYLFRTHFRAGTNGMLFHKQHFICFCIELPLRLKQGNNSCISDGVYVLERCYSLQLGHHVRVARGAERCGILFRADTVEPDEVAGSIIPVEQVTGIGKGMGAKSALHKMLMRMEAVGKAGEPFFLTVTSVHSGR